MLNLCKTCLPTFFLSVFLIGCTTSTTSQKTRCSIEVAIEGPLIAGESNSIEAYPLTDILDTLVLLNDEEVAVKGLNKVECASCEECKISYGCSDCDFCPNCQTSCGECMHLLDIDIPADAVDPSILTIYNVYGSSDPLEVEIHESEN